MKTLKFDFDDPTYTDWLTELIGVPAETFEKEVEALIEEYPALTDIRLLPYLDPETGDIILAKRLFLASSEFRLAPDRKTVLVFECKGGVRVEYHGAFLSKFASLLMERDVDDLPDTLFTV